MAHPADCPCQSCANWRTITTNRQAMAEHLKQQKRHAREQTADLLVMYNQKLDEFEFVQGDVRVRGKVSTRDGGNILNSQGDQIPIRNFNLLSNDAAFRVILEARDKGVVCIGDFLGEGDG